MKAFRKHALHDPLVDPGSADLTADVDFRRMKHTAEKNNQVVTFGPIKQGIFLQQMQGDVRLEVKTYILTYLVIILIQI